MKKISAYFLVLAILTLISCKDSKKPKTTMNNSDKPAVNYELSFTVYNKNKLESYSKASARPIKDYIEVLDSLIDAVNLYESDTTGEYYNYYKRYNYIPLNNYVLSAKAAKASLKANLEKAKIAAVNNAVNRSNSATADHFDLIKECSETFKKEWVLSPSYSFSNHLIDVVFESKHELLYNHYLYDGNISSPYRLPITSALHNVGDDSMISPHNIDEKRAKELISDLDKYPLEKNPFFKSEIDFFRSLLKKVISGEIILCLNNYSQ